MSTSSPHTPPDTRAVVTDLWTRAGHGPEALDALTLTGGDTPVLPSVLAVDTAATACTALTGLAAAEVHRLAGGPWQTVTVDRRHAALAYRSERYLRIEGSTPTVEHPAGNYFRTRDGGWVQLHMAYPHHRDGTLRRLDCGPQRADIERAVRGWDAAALEEALFEAGVCATRLRDRDAWLAHPQGAAVDALPPFELLRMDDAPPRPLPQGDRPLAGLRVLDLTHVIAGPVCGRTLAEHGADVLHVHAPHRPSLPLLVMDTGRGKRTTCLDLRAGTDRERFEALVADADVVVQGYRPGAFEALGYSARRLAALCPGLVYLTLCAWSHAGPWRDRRGFDSLVQTASGIADAGGRASGGDAPRALPCQALDHSTGYLAAFLVMTALARRATMGGSWRIRLSLAQTASWLWRLGPVDTLHAPDPTASDAAEFLEVTDSGFGRMHAVRPVPELSRTPAYHALPAQPIGTHDPAWATR
ncbi:MAG: CoA transferase [Ectothiorhodospiraceae bacterium]|nr:CoA transferase [Chromatiales bacterium]MCP5154372.1 CoA transferase [Ectothiorhodospiraceae bacterium]